MASMPRFTIAKAVHRDTLSALLNCICPDYDGGMKEFKCFRECGRDWRSEWESAKGELKSKKTRQ